MGKKNEKSLERNTKLLEFLRSQGYALAFDNKKISEWKIREQLIKKKYFNDKKSAKEYLKSNLILEKFPKQRFSVEQGIELIHKLGLLRN